MQHILCDIHYNYMLHNIHIQCIVQTIPYKMKLFIHCPVLLYVVMLYVFYIRCMFIKHTLKYNIVLLHNIIHCNVICAIYFMYLGCQ